jgi:hypothetical protein
MTFFDTFKKLFSIVINQLWQSNFAKNLIILFGSRNDNTRRFDLNLALVDLGCFTYVRTIAHAVNDMLLSRIAVAKKDNEQAEWLLVRLILVEKRK